MPFLWLSPVLECLTKQKHVRVPFYVLFTLSPFCLCPGVTEMGHSIMHERMVKGQKNCSIISEFEIKSASPLSRISQKHKIEAHSCQMKVQQKSIVWQKSQNQSWLSNMLLQSYLTLSGLLNQLRFIYFQMRLMMPNLHNVRIRSVTIFKMFSMWCLVMVWVQEMLTDIIFPSIEE